MFKPYQGNDVSAEYTRCSLPKIGEVWVCAHASTNEERRWTGEKYFLEILGWGEQPSVSFSSLPFSSLPVEVQREVQRQLNKENCQ